MTSGQALAGPNDERFDPPLTLLPRQVRQSSNVTHSIFAGWLLAFLPSIVIGMLVSLLMPAGSQPRFEVGTVSTLLLIVGFAPVMETLIMGGALLILLRFVGPTVAVLMSSLGWGIAHSLAAPAWGLVIWWPFLVFSTLFVTWRQRSMIAAFAIPAVVHALHNLPSGLLLLLFPDQVI